jgi:methyl coenzyme M reductase subunit C
MGVGVGGSVAVGGTVGDTGTVGLGVGVAVALAPHALSTRTKSIRAITKKVFRMFMKTSERFFDSGSRAHQKKEQGGHGSIDDETQ